MKKGILVLVTLFLVVILGGCGQTNQRIPGPDTIQQSQPGDSVDSSVSAKTYTFPEIKQHNNQEDCWMIIDNQIYDLTGYIPQHPGGDKIIQGCGQDATSLFNNQPKHAEKQTILNKYQIGVLP